MSTLESFRAATLSLKMANEALEERNLCASRMKAPALGVRVADGGSGFGFSVREATMDENALFRGHDGASLTMSDDVWEALGEAESLMEGHGLTERLDEVRMLRARVAGLRLGVKEAESVLEKDYGDDAREKAVEEREVQEKTEMKELEETKEREVESLLRDLANRKDGIEEAERILASLREDLEDTSDLDERIQSARSRRDTLQEEAETLKEAVDRATRQLEELMSAAMTVQNRTSPTTPSKKSPSSTSTTTPETDKLLEEERQLQEELHTLEQQARRADRDDVIAAKTAHEKGKRIAERDLADAIAAAEKQETALRSLQASHQWLLSRTQHIVDQAALQSDPRAKALQILRENGGEMPMNDLKEIVPVQHIYKLLGAHFVRINRGDGPTTVTALVM